MTAATLPDTLSGLIAAAVRDARSLDRSRYIPHSREWHVPENKHCLVCLAGTMIAGSLNARPQREYSPSDFTQDAMNKLYALNRTRYGNWIAAWDHFYGNLPSPYTCSKLAALPAPACHWFADWTQFDKCLRSLERIIPQLRDIEQLATLR